MLTSRYELITARSVWSGGDEELAATVVMEVARNRGTSGVFHRIKRNWRTAFAFQLLREFTIQSRLRASCSVWDGRSASPRAKWIGKMASEIIAMKLPPTLEHAQCTTAIEPKNRHMTKLRLLERSAVGTVVGSVIVEPRR